MKFYTYQKGVWKKLSHAEIGGAKQFEVVLTPELEVLVILKGDPKIPLFKRETSLTPSWVGGGGGKKFQTCDFPIL